MALDEPRSGRLVSFRLCELDEKVLQRGKSIALKQEDDFVLSVAIGAAAERPSSRVYWISAKAYERVVGAPGRA